MGWGLQGQGGLELLSIVPPHLSGPEEMVASNVLVFDGGKKLATRAHDTNSSDFLIHPLRKVVDILLGHLACGLPPPPTLSCRKFPGRIKQPSALLN